MNGDEDLDSGLLGIALSDSDAESGDNATATKKTSQEKRTGQSEAEFQEVKRTYHVKVEDGEIWKTVQLPLGPRVSKPEAQALQHAVEELYFFRRFSEGARFARSVLDDDAGAGKLDEDTTLHFMSTIGFEEELDITVNLRV
ncbi:hypothetical protein HD806DRAFT_532970 [Xylariaceae sp. AK1471]|nr:hypothetical protein HD806DRAFT_532970 [Xylariaceae sp. AK1471]